MTTEKAIATKQTKAEILSTITEKSKLTKAQVKGVLEALATAPAVRRGYYDQGEAGAESHSRAAAQGLEERAQLTRVWPLRPFLVY